MTQLTRDQQAWLDELGPLPELVVDLAKDLWQHAGVPADFCLQHVTADAILFGSTNRVRWSVRHGFRLVDARLPFQDAFRDWINR